MSMALGLLHLSARLPWRLNRGLAALVGGLLYRLPNRERAIARTNLRLCFPELDERQHEALLRDALLETARTGLELGRFWFAPLNEVLGMIREVRGEAAVEAAMAAGRGVIIAAPHLGNWELVGLYCSRRYAMTSLYRPPRRVALDAPIRTARERAGARLVPTDIHGVRALRATLGEGRMIGILPDQDPGASGSAFAPFFGQPARTMLLLSRLAAKSGAPVFLTWAQRHGDGFVLHFERAEAAVAERDGVVAATALNHAVEGCVRQAPAQYQWCYQRFKAQPDGLPSPYPDRLRLKKRLRRLRKRLRRLKGQS